MGLQCLRPGPAGTRRRAVADRGREVRAVELRRLAGAAELAPCLSGQRPELCCGRRSRGRCGRRRGSIASWNSCRCCRRRPIQGGKGGRRGSGLSRPAVELAEPVGQRFLQFLQRPQDDRIRSRPALFPVELLNGRRGHTYGIEAWAKAQVTPWWRALAGRDDAAQELSHGRRPGGLPAAQFARRRPALAGGRKLRHGPDAQAQADARRARRRRTRSPAARCPAMSRPAGSWPTT